MQDDLFGAPPPAAPTPKLSAASTASRRTAQGVRPAALPEELLTLASAIPVGLRLGVSTWSYPGWEGLVWDGAYDSSVLSRKGLTALSAHPLMGTVCVDRTFWRPLTVEQYAQYAAQVPDDFCFMVKCPNAVTDALVRDPEGQGQQPNPAFLDAQIALTQFVQPALEGLGPKLGVLVFQLSPLPWQWLRDFSQLMQRLRELLAQVREALRTHPQVIVAVEVRDPELLTPALADVLKAHQATYCLGLHGKMPPIEQQLPILRALWPSPLVCRWNLNRIFGPYGYPAAQEKHQPFNTIVSPDPYTRKQLATVIRGVTGAGYRAFVTISNDAEGCAPRSIVLLIEELAALSSR